LELAHEKPQFTFRGGFLLCSLLLGFPTRNPCPQILDARFEFFFLDPPFGIAVDEPGKGFP
jgi:hypothetical protein